MTAGDETMRPAPRKGGLLTIPNLLTLSRIFAVPLLVLLMWGGDPGSYLAAFALYVVAAVTDYFDGMLARAQGSVSKLGVFLDPIADKIMVCALIVMLVAADDLQGIHVAAGVIILVREIAVSGLREFLGGLRVSLPVTRIAKWKTTLQMIGLGGILLAGGFPNVEWLSMAALTCFWIAALLTVYTGWDYLRVGLKHMD